MNTAKASPRLRKPRDDAFAADAARLEHELGALLELATEIAAAVTLDDVLETAAEQASTALGAVLAIERRELDRACTEVLAGAHEAHWTADALDAPVLIRGEVWGWMRATRPIERRVFDAGDVRFLEAIADQLVTAIGRANVVAELTRLAFEDALTGLANRRALDRWLEPALVRALAAGHEVALVICDLDHLKILNDRQGHSAGDAALLRVAETLAAVAQRHSQHFVARLSGDEFCLVLPDCDIGRARELAEQVYGIIDVGDGAQITISSGLAMLAGTDGGSGDLLRAADAALFSAKRAGRGRLALAGDACSSAEPGDDAHASRAYRGRGAEPHGLSFIDDGLAALDQLGVAPPQERLEALLMAAAGGLDATAWSLSHVAEGSDLLQTLSALGLRATKPAVVPDHDEYSLGDHPETARLLRDGGAFEVRLDDETADPSQRALLTALGSDRLLAIGVPTPAGAWLIEIYGDARSLPLHPMAAPLRVLAAEAVRASALTSQEPDQGAPRYRIAGRRTADPPPQS
jgi:diguanylate cyclase (GGDEF)-like protein